MQDFKNQVKRIQSCLTDDLLKKEYRGNNNPLYGHCYVATESTYYLFAKDLGYYPCHINHENSSHWFLKNDKDKIIDITVSQFKTKPKYHLAKRIGFLTNYPSKRAKIVMEKYNELGQ